ncbi:MAG TPA: DUF6629 family protein, partial [Gaiellaceae bacterium]|nr:DUF6629 family protein [Gaiellaceae bacterium]
FASGAVIGVIGVATLTKVTRPREIPLAALPLAFALHQVVEGFVWRDLDDGSARATGIAVVLYVVFAWIVLPVLVPLSIMLVEPAGRPRRRIGALVGLGAVASVILGGYVVNGTVSARAVEHTLQYGGAGRWAWVATILYVIATCGAPLLSGFRAIAWFGVANVIAVAAIVVVQTEGLTSVWCLWAAVVSVLIFVQFTWWRQDDVSAMTPAGAAPR